MTDIEGLMQGMSLRELGVFLAVVSKEIGEKMDSLEVLEKAVYENITDLKERWAALSTDDWEQFCMNLNSICRDTRATWGGIERCNDLKNASEGKENLAKVQGFLDSGFQFDKISVNGSAFMVCDGKVIEETANVPDDQIPF